MTDKIQLGQLVQNYKTSTTLDYNFAYGGATVDANLVKPYSSSVKTLVDQVGEWQNTVANKPSYAPWKSGNALFAIWLGVNDIGNSYGQSNEASLVNQILDVSRII